VVTTARGVEEGMEEGMEETTQGEEEGGGGATFKGKDMGTGTGKVHGVKLGVFPRVPHPRRMLGGEGRY